MKTDLLAGLNQQQLQSVTHQGSPLLILAGAGSGKTRVLTLRAAWFIEQKLAAPSEILLLTFTNKAAEEMKHRMYQLLGVDKLDLYAGTYHSFCCRLLRQYGSLLNLSPNFVIYDSDDQQSLIKAILRQMGLSTQEFKPSSVGYFIEEAKNNFRSPADVAATSSGFWQDRCARVYQIYQKRLMEVNAVDFNDLLFYAVHLLKTHSEVLKAYQAKYPFILVDEYQDTNQIQYDMTKALALSSGNITAVGDASQAIYGWRGANFRNLISFKDDFSHTTIINLEQNYRSTKIILDSANSIISHNTTHPVLSLQSTIPGGEKVKIFESDSEVSEAEYVSSEINYLTNDLHFKPSDIAVLYRTNAQSRVFEESFIKHQIPYVLIGGIRFYDRAEVKDIVAMLRLATNPKDDISETRVEKAVGKRKTALIHTVIRNFHTDKDSSVDILERLVVDSGYLSKFNPQVEEDRRRIENIKELKSVASTFPKLSEFLENIALVQQEYSLQEKNKKNEAKNGVRLMTFHSSKGLEFDNVFLVGFEEGILPHAQSMGTLDGVEEERRLCYVGITRARRRLYITYATRRLFIGKSSLNEPSRFISELPPDLIDYTTNVNPVRNYRLRQNDDDYYYDSNIY
jgi:DNA helicase II / ATP-dependent DNA helicase PcrA